MLLVGVSMSALEVMQGGEIPIFRIHINLVYRAEFFSFK